MKKFILVFLIAVLMPLSLLTADNLQKLYTTRDDIYQRVDELCTRAAVLGPSTFSPVPGRALIIALERINTSLLSEEDRDEYIELYSSITEGSYIFEEDYFRFNISPSVNLGINIADYDDFDYGNIHYDTPQPDRREYTLLPYRYEPALFSLSFEMGFSDHINMDARFDVKNRNQRMLETTLASIYTNQTVYNGTKAVSGLFTGFATELPYRAGISIGNDYVNFTAGRYPHSMGNGITGNLLVGDNFNYQEIITLSFMSRRFTYNISVTHFNQQYTIDNLTNTAFSKNEFSEDQQFRVVHRFDLSLFDNVRFVLNLATLYNTDNTLDIRFFYPFVLSHNYYNYSNGISLKDYDEANNLMTFELDWTITEGLRLGMQFALDQFQMPWEDMADVPLAFGIAGNIKYSSKIGDGRFNLWFESVYTNPYLYLNGKRDYGANDVVNRIEHNLDYIVGYQSEYMDDYGYSGYIYGPDNIVFSIGANYSASDEKFETGGNILYRIQGKKGTKHSARNSKQTVIDVSNAVIEESGFMENIFTPSGGWEKAEHFIKMAVYYVYNFDNSWGDISLYSAIGANVFFNYNHVKGASQFQPQMLIGAKYTY